MVLHIAFDNRLQRISPTWDVAVLVAGIFRINIFQSVSIFMFFDVGPWRHGAFFTNAWRAVCPWFWSFGTFFATTIWAALGSGRSLTALRTSFGTALWTTFGASFDTSLRSAFVTAWCIAIWIAAFTGWFVAAGTGLRRTFGIAILATARAFPTGATFRQAFGSITGTFAG